MTILDFAAIAARSEESQMKLVEIVDIQFVQIANTNIGEVFLTFVKLYIRKYFRCKCNVRYLYVIVVNIIIVQIVIINIG